MKPGKLYIRIFLSFLLVLCVTEILVFGLFMFSAKRIYHSRMEQHTRAQILVTRELIEEKIKSQPGVPPKDNEPLRDLIRRLGEAHGSRVWLAGRNGTPLVTSFSDELPGDVIKVAHKRAKDHGGYRMHTDFGKKGFFYIVIPTDLGDGSTGNLHMLSERIEPDRHGGGFALGLAGIGLVIALLVRPVSRHITEPLKQLRYSALQFAEGNLSLRATVKRKDEIGELGRAFNIMADKLERMIRGGKELTANVSHELRTPLARIRIAEELLRQKLEHGSVRDWRRHLDDIREDIAELDHLIDRILALSKLDVTETSFQKERIDLSDLVGELLEKSTPARERRRLRIVTDLSSGLFVLGDKKALQTALSNVIDNAVKFTAEGGDVIVRTGFEDRSVTVSVINSFEALPDEDLKRVFEPFYRTRTIREAGSGLGLAITKKIIEKHAGQIAAENTPEGFKIEIRLPLAPSTPAD
jgi:two-component system sensor histidine kinase CpxA